MVVSAGGIRALTRHVNTMRIRHRRSDTVGEYHSIVGCADEFHVAHAVVGDLLVTARAELVVDTTAVNALPFRTLQTQDSGQPIEGDKLARRPFVPLVHGVEDRLRAVPGEGQIDRRSDALDDAPLVEEGQIEVEEVVPDDGVASYVKILQESPEALKRARLVEMEQHRLPLAPEQSSVDDLLVMLHNQPDG